MGEKDSLTKKFMSRPDVFADAFNYLIYTDSAFLPYVSNYKINLITPDTISDEKLARIPSEFRQAMKFIQVSGDDRRFDEEIMGNPDYRHLEHDTAVMLRVLTHLDIEIEEGEKEVNMCTAVEKLIEKRGQSYLRQGLSIGREEGMFIGRGEAITNTIRLLREMQIADDEISRRMQKQFSLTPEQMAHYLAAE